MLKKQKLEAEKEAKVVVTTVKSEYQRKMNILEESQSETNEKYLEAHTLEKQLSQEVEARAEQKIKDKIAILQTQFKVKESSLVSYVAIFGVLTAIVTILSLIRQKTFWGDFRAFWVGLWNIIVLLFEFAFEGIYFVASLCDMIPQPYVAFALHWIVFAGLFVGLGALILFGGMNLIEFAIEPITDGINPWNFSISVIALVVVVFFGDYIKNIIKFNLFGIWIILIIILIGGGMYLQRPRKY